jgi:hypothetical protein
LSTGKINKEVGKVSENTEYPKWFTYKVSQFTKVFQYNVGGGNVSRQINEGLVKRGIDASDVIAIDRFERVITVFYREKIN